MQTHEMYGQIGMAGVRSISLDDQGRLHADNKPALEMEDGTFYFCHKGKVLFHGEGDWRGGLRSVLETSLYLWGQSQDRYQRLMEHRGDRGPFKEGLLVDLAMLIAFVADMEAHPFPLSPELPELPGLTDRFAEWAEASLKLDRETLEGSAADSCWHDLSIERQGEWMERFEDSFFSEWLDMVNQIRLYLSEVSGTRS